MDNSLFFLTRKYFHSRQTDIAKGMGGPKLKLHISNLWPTQDTANFALSTSIVRPRPRSGCQPSLSPPPEHGLACHQRPSRRIVGSEQTRALYSTLGRLKQVKVGRLILGKASMKKKNVFFRALPELPNPPSPHDPNSGNLVLFFRKSKFKI